MSEEKGKSFSDISDEKKEMELKEENGNSSTENRSTENRSTENRSTYEKFKQAITPDRNFLPLKMTWFFFTSSSFALLPYLTIHMKDIGISVEHIAVMYAILPFTIFVAPPLIGFLADKLGSYTKVVLLTIVASAIFHTLLLFVPTSLIVEHPPKATAFLMRHKLASFSWTPCYESEPSTSCDKDDENLAVFIANNTLIPSLNLEHCKLECSDGSDASDVCHALAHIPTCNSTSDGTDLLFENVTISIDSLSKCDRQASVHLLSHGLPISLHHGCELKCHVRSSNEIAKCSYTDGSRAVTNIVYFIFRSLATMGLGCNYVLLDAQTIQMVKVDEAAGNKGSLGRQFVMQAVAQAIISPIVGKLMDVISVEGEPPNYLFPFLIGDFFLVLTFIMILFIKMDLSLPKSTGWAGLKKIFTNLDMCVFLFVVFILGNCFGFVETFLFVYLKDELGAPMYLLGLTVTTGALVSIPFLYVADAIVDKVGQTNVFITALLTYGVRYVGYSHITNPWLSFPFEALELFTLQLFKIALAQYVGQHSPPGLLATLNGIAGCLHYSLGRGTGGLIGGTIVAVTGSLAVAFRYFGVGSAVAGLLYFCYEFFYAGGFRTWCKQEEKNSEDSTSGDKELGEPMETKLPLMTTEKQSSSEIDEKQ